MVKQAKYKELAPFDKNWFYLWTAFMVGHLYLHGDAGVGSMTKTYGRCQRNGIMPSFFSKVSKSAAG